MKKLNEFNLKLLWECCQIPDFVKKLMVTTMK